MLADVVRLSDEAETRMSLQLAGSGGVKGRLGRAYLDLRGRSDGCLAILGFEGSRRGRRLQARARALALLRGCGGLARRALARRGLADAAASPAPYLRDELLTQGVMVETLETATQWSSVHALHRAVAQAITGALAPGGTPALVMCHVSHVYETGASLYFTFIARQREGDELAPVADRQGGRRERDPRGRGDDHPSPRRRPRSRAVDGAEIGGGGLAALRALKAELDPAGIMNPGKLLPA